MELTALQQLVHQMYIAYYQRPADPDGLQYWVDQLEQNGDWTAVSAAFGAPENEENQALYGDLNREQTIAAIYQSAFNREAVAEEVAFWAASEFSATDLTFAIVNGAQNSDKATVDNKVAFSAELVAQVGTNAAYAELQDPKALLTAVTEETEVTAGYVSDAVASGKVGEAFSLTANTDSFAGTTGIDTFEGTTATFGGDADVIVDGSSADSDILNLTSVTSSIVAGDFSVVSGVENVNVTTETAAAFSMDASKFSGVKNLTVSRGDLADGLIDGTGTVAVTALDASKVAKVTTGEQVTNATITQATKAGATVDADTATGTVAVTGAAAIDAAAAKTAVTVTALGDATEDAKAVTVNAAETATVTTAVGFTGSVEVNAAKATTVTVNNAEGGATVNAAATPAAATTITVNGIDDSGASVTAGSFAATGTTGTIALGGTAGTSDAATVSAAGVVTLNSSTVDALTLSGNGADVTYTIGAGAVYDSIVGAGDYAVNIKTDADDLTTETVSGVNVVTINGAASAGVDFSKVTATSIDLDVDVDQAITVADGAAIEINADQNASTATTEIVAKTDNADLNLTAGDDTAGSTASTILTGALDLNGATTDFATVNVTAETAALTATSVDADDAAIAISGSKNVTLGQVTAGSLNANSMTGVLNMTQFATTASVVSGSGNDVIIMDNNAGSTVMSLNAGDGNNNVTVTDVANGSTVITGAGNDTINLDDTTSLVVQGGGGNDNYVMSVDADVVIADSAGGADKIEFDQAGAIDLTNNGNFSFSGIESVDITAVNGAISMDAADLSGKTLSVVGDATADILKAVGDDEGTASVDTIDLSGLTVSGTATIQIDGGDKADTLIGSATASTNFLIDSGDFDAGESITGGSAADTITLSADTDLSVGTISSVETLATGGFAATIGQGAGITSVTGYADGTADQFIVTKSSTSFEAAAEGGAVDVDTAGEWYFAQETGAPTDSALTYFDEALGEAVTITLTGTGGAGANDTASVVAGNLVVDIA